MYHVTGTDTTDAEPVVNSGMGLLVYRIPFMHPSHVAEILQVALLSRFACLFVYMFVFLLVIHGSAFMPRECAYANRVTFQAVSKIDKSISKRIIFGLTKRTGARRWHPQDIRRMPMFVCLFFVKVCLFCCSCCLVLLYCLFVWPCLCFLLCLLAFVLINV